MVFGIEKNTIENLIILLVGVLLFNGLTNTKFIGDYFRQYPLLVVCLAVLLLVFSGKIADALKFIQPNYTKNIIYLTAGILLFNGLVNTQWVSPYFKSYPLVIVVVAIILLALKDKISETIGG